MYLGKSLNTYRFLKPHPIRPYVRLGLSKIVAYGDCQECFGFAGILEF